VNVLVTGFGAFPGVDDNPTARLAMQLDGAVLPGERPEQVIGRVLPVSYRRGPQEAIRLAREHEVALVLGFGVARGRPQVCIERQGVRVEQGSPDVDGETVTGMDGPEVVPATIDTQLLLEALQASPSDDAGRYVCNAWLYEVSRALTVPVGFVHVPEEGLAPERALLALARLVRAPSRGSSQAS
jgi:pyroglutamyl-peptidase